MNFVLHLAAYKAWRNVPLFQIHVFDSGEAVSEHVRAGLTLFQHDVTNQRLVEPVSWLYVNKENFIEDRAKACDLNFYRPIDFTLDDILERPFQDQFRRLTQVLQASLSKR